MGATITVQAHRAIAERMPCGGRAVDATAGNGKDTLFLAQSVGENGHVWSLDIQDAALKNTTALLERSNLKHRVTLIQSSHAEMRSAIPSEMSGTINAVMFNLGYLPGGERKWITTVAESTIAGLVAATELLAPRGRISVLCYPGHSEGARELRCIEEWIKSDYLPSCLTVNWIVSDQMNLTAPRLLLITRN